MTTLHASFPSKARVEVRVGRHVVATDRTPDQGGDDAAPAAFDLFLASIAACAGTYALAFCAARGIDTAGMDVSLRCEEDPETHLPTRFELDVVPPPALPEHLRAPLVRAVSGCKVKKTIALGPTFDVRLAAGEA